MSNMKFAMLANMVIEAVYAVCVTVAAIYFGRAAILWWYLLLLVMGCTYKESVAK